MKKIKEMLFDKKFYIYIIISIIFFGIFFKLEYATDTYTVFENTTKETVEHFFESGRFVTGICQAIIRLVHINNTFTYLISFILGIISLSIALYKLEKIFEQDIGENITIAILTSVLVIINVFSIELFLYIEKGILLLSVLLNVLAVEKLILYIKGNKKAVIWALLYMFIANCCYQGTVSLFVMLGLVYVIKYSKTFKDFLKNTVILAFTYGIPALINYAVVKFIFANSRIAGDFDFALSIQKIIEGSQKLFFTYSILPKYLFMSVIALLFICILYFSINQKKSTYDKIVPVVSIVFIVLGSLIATILPQFMQATSSIWFVPRSSYAFGGIIGILILFLFMNFKVNKKLEKILIMGMILYLVVQYVNFQDIALDHYLVNYMDEIQAMQIKEKIATYEEQTGKTVTKVAFYESDLPSWTYPNIRAIGDINIKALSPAWSRIPYLKHYLDRSLEEVDKQEEIEKEFFENKENIIIIREDTLHLYIT